MVGCFIAWEQPSRDSAKTACPVRPPLGTGLGDGWPPYATTIGKRPLPMPPVAVGAL